MGNVSSEQDEGWLFISETGTRVNEGNYLRSLKKIGKWAGVPYVNNHMSRRFTLNRLVKVNPKAAKDIAGHKSMDTTMMYTEIDEEFNREQHEIAGIVRGLLTSTRTIKRKRLV